MLGEIPICSSSAIMVNPPITSGGKHPNIPPLDKHPYTGKAMQEHHLLLERNHELSSDVDVPSPLRLSQLEAVNPA